MKRLALLVCIILIIGVDVANAGLMDGLVSYYPFNGDALDSSGNNLHGIVSGASLTQDRYGNADCAYEFNGVDDYIDMGNSDLFDITNSITLSAWVKPDEYTSGRYIISKAEPSSNAANYSLITPYDRATFSYWDGVGNDKKYMTDISMERDQWYNISISYDYTTFEIKTYLNGDQIYGNWVTTDYEPGNEPVNDTPVLTDNHFSIGASLVYYPGGSTSGLNVGDPYAPFDGIIDEVRIYNRLLSKAEIQALSSIQVTDEFSYTTDYMKLGETISFEYWWEMGIDPPLYQQGCMFDVLALQGGDGWQYIGQTGTYLSSNAWEEATFIVPGELQGMETQIRFVLTDYYPDTNPSIYLKGINSSPAPVPEPSTMILIGSGLIGLAGFRKKFNK